MNGGFNLRFQCGFSSLDYWKGESLEHVFYKGNLRYCKHFSGWRRKSYTRQKPRRPVRTLSWNSRNCDCSESSTEATQIFHLVQAYFLPRLLPEQQVDLKMWRWSRRRGKQVEEHSHSYAANRVVIWDSQVNLNISSIALKILHTRWLRWRGKR